MRKPSPAPIVNAEAGQSTVEFFGLNFNAIDENMAVRQIRHLEQKSGYFYVVTPNVDHIVQLDIRGPRVRQLSNHLDNCRQPLDNREFHLDNWSVGLVVV